MNDQKLQHLFAAVRREAPPVPPAGFSTEVTDAVRQEPAFADPTLVDQLAGLFPQLAMAAVVVLGLCVAADLGHGLMPGPDLSDGVAQLCGQLDFPKPKL